MNEARFREAERRLWASVGVTPTEQRVRLERTGVTARVQETGVGPPVLFVHGTTSSGAGWASLVGRLEGFRCLMLDRPGCGLSEPVGARFDDLDVLAAFADGLVVDVLDALDLESAHVVATSFGGFMALRGAAAHPERIDRLVEFGWMVGAPNGRLPALMRMTGVPGLGRLMAAIPLNARAVRAMCRQIGLGQALDAGRISDEFIDCFLAILRDTDTMRNELRAGPRLIRPLKGWDERIVLPAGLLAEVRAPTYFLWGEEDPFGGAAQARQFVSQLPEAQLEIMPGAGHAVWLDDAEHAAKTVTAFLGRA